MQVISMTEARKNLKMIFDSVYLHNDEVIIHRKDKENVVMISLEEYNLLSSLKAHDHMSWDDKELANIGKIGHNSKSFVDDSEDYSKW